MNAIILYDGDCRFCNLAVQFIIKRDPKMYFKFAHLSSKSGKQLIDNLNIPNDEDSLIVIYNENYFIQSTAALMISKKLNKGWPLLYGLIIIPKKLRNYIYQIVANNRYKLFGQATSCQLPSPKDVQRFLL